MAEDPKQDSLKQPRNPRELLLEQHFLPWFATTLKELKCDHLTLFIHPRFEAVIQSLKVPKNSHDQPDFTRLNMEQYLQFRNAFIEERMFNDVFRANKGNRAMDLILTGLCLIICNRLPKGVVPFRTETLNQKIRFVFTPKGLEIANRTVVEKVPVTAENPTGEHHVLIEKNTNERALVRILVPKRAMTLSETNREKEEDDERDEAKDGEDNDKSPTLTRVNSEKFVDLDQEDKVLPISNRINVPNSSPYMVLVMNTFAAKTHR